MSWVVFSYTETLYPEYPYLYVILETDRKSADKYMKDHFRFSDEYLSNNFCVFIYKELHDLASDLEINIDNIYTSKHILIEDKSKFGDGMYCSECYEWYPYAEENQKDGTLICYLCRHASMLFE